MSNLGKLFGRNRSIDLTNAQKLSTLEDGTEFEVDIFDIINSHKHGSDFIVICTVDGGIYTTWSKVIIDKFAKVNIEQIEGVKFVLRHRKSHKGFNYLDVLLK